MSEAEEYIGDSYTYNEKLNNLKTEFFSVLEDFKKYYVYSYILYTNSEKMG